MKVVFVRDKRMSDSSFTGNLTEGKSYYAEFYNAGDSNDSYYKIENDCGLVKEYYSSHFMKIEDWRERQLNKLI